MVQKTKGDLPCASLGSQRKTQDSMQAEVMSCIIGGMFEVYGDIALLGACYDGIGNLLEPTQSLRWIFPSRDLTCYTAILTKCPRSKPKNTFPQSSMEAHRGPR